MTTLQPIHLQATLVQAGLWHAAVGARLADAAYAPPLSAWLLADFGPWFEQCLMRLGISGYVAEAGDCDDYAALYAALAKVCHRRMPGCAGTALPIGPLYYRRGGEGGVEAHAIVCAITSDRGCVFIEPQTRAEVQLTPAEKHSAWHLQL